MRLLEQEKDPEVLRELAKWIMAHNERLQKENDTLREEVAQRKQIKLNIEDQLLKLKKLIFARGREKRPEANDRPRPTDEVELLVHGQSLIPAPKQKKKAPPLEEEICPFEMTDRELIEESKMRGFENPGVSDWKPMKNFFDEATEITLIERKYIKRRNQRQKYICTRENLGKEIIITAPGPKKLIPGSSYSIDFGVAVVSDKYVNHIPLERQCRQMESLGLKGMQPRTLYNLCYFVGLHLDEVASRIRAEILSSKLCVHADETPWPINTSKEDDGYMWSISNQAGTYYKFESTRSGDIAKEILKGYQGPVLTDGYQGYNKVKAIEGIRLSYCWAHVRRKFFEIEPNYPTECKEILDLIDKLFEIERRAKTIEELKLLREVHSKPLIEEIAMWLTMRERQARAESGLKKVIDYALKLWSGLKLFLDDATVPLTNNDVERAMRHAVMGRKNFYGSRSINGADLAATLYTVIQSCKKVELDPRTFIAMAVRMSAGGEVPPTPLEYARKTRIENTSSN